MIAVLRWVGLGKLVSFYRYFAFNIPRVTTASGIVLLVGVATIRLYLLLGDFAIPAYLAAYFALLVAVALLASLGMMVGRTRLVPRVGWALGSLVSVASIAMYVVSRTAGLPGLPQLVNRWDYPLGSFALVLAALFLVLHFSVRTGMNVAHPQRRQWHD